MHSSRQCPHALIITIPVIYINNAFIYSASINFALTVCPAYEEKKGREAAVQPVPAFRKQMVPRQNDTDTKKAE